MTENIPKSLIEVNGTPFIVHQLRLLRASGIRRVVLCVSYLGSMIQDAIEDGSSFDLQVDYSFDGAALLGTGGAIKNALGKLGESFFVMYGDSYLACDYEAIARNFESAGVLGMMTVFRNDGKWDASNVEFNGENIVAYNKTDRTPGMRYIDYGLGTFRAQAFAGVPDRGTCDLESVYNDLLRRNQLAAFEVRERFYEIGSPAGLRETAQYLAAHSVAK